MVSSVGRANGDRGGKDGDGLPPWLVAFLHATYFERCSLHADSHRNQRNIFCTDCMGDPSCLYCARIDHKGHSVIQVRKYCYREVVRAREIREFIDISGIQTFITNKAEVVFLNKRPQTIPGKPVINACEVCHKALAIPFRFCSIGCKLGVMKRGDMNLSYDSNEMEDSSSGTESVVSSMPGKVQKTRHSGGPRIGVPVPDQKAADGCNPYSDDAEAAASTKAAFDHSNSRKRKGTPRRAPCFSSDHITRKQSRIP